MRTALRSLIFAAALAATAFAAGAQTTPSPAKCDDQTKADLYKRFTDGHKGDANQQKVAYEAGKQYVAVCTEDDQYRQYITRWLAAYDKAAREFEVGASLTNAERDKRYAEAVRAGKEMLAIRPDDLTLLMRVAWDGYNGVASKAEGVDVAAAQGAATTALQMIGAGKKPADRYDEQTKTYVANWWPFPGREDAVGGLNFALGNFALASNRADDAIKYLYAAAQAGGFAQKAPQTYLFLGNAYTAARYTPLSQDFNARFGGKPESPESTAALARLNESVDHVIDAYARAAALTTDQQTKAALVQQLTAFYKFRHDNSDAGLQDFIAHVLAQPMPAP
ncbi:MAG: hypothetical protein M3268_05990 [Acidobacteriota bacterium]|nr:hypothetical protein [Acidobacteriota bacterium]